MKFNIQIASCSEPGLRHYNEDSLRFGSNAQRSYAVLADGAGGHSRGSEESHRAVLRVEATLSDVGMAFAPEVLTDALCAAHRELCDHQATDNPQAKMHSTVVALWIDAQTRLALWSHVGDSRLYRLRRGRTDFVTADDSVVQRLLSAGVIDASQVQSHPQKNQLLSALGTAGDVRPHTVPRPVALHDGDAFLLCSDGWWEQLDEGRLVGSLRQASDPHQWLESMRSHIAKQQKPRQDNYSAVALWVGEPQRSSVLGDDETRP